MGDMYRVLPSPWAQVLRRPVIQDEEQSPTMERPQHLPPPSSRDEGLILLPGEQARQPAVTQLPFLPPHLRVGLLGPPGNRPNFVKWGLGLRAMVLLLLRVMSSVTHRPQEQSGPQSQEQPSQLQLCKAQVVALSLVLQVLRLPLRYRQRQYPAARTCLNVLQGQANQA